MSSLPRYIPRYTVADYALWEGDWELWDGIAIAMTPSPFGAHSRLTVELARRLANAIEQIDCQATVLSEIDWIISENTVVRPDVLIVCGREPERHVEQTPPVVVEILSDGTRERDLNEKRILYQQQGVANYIIVDSLNSILSLLQLGNGVYDQSDVRESMSLHICDSCDLQVSTSGLFR